MSTATLIDGKIVEVLGEINIEHQPHVICKLPNAIYYGSNLLIRTVAISAHQFAEFKAKHEFVEQINQEVKNENV